METRFDLCSLVCTLAYLAICLFPCLFFGSLPLSQWGHGINNGEAEVGRLTFEKGLTCMYASFKASYVFLKCGKQNECNTKGRQARGERKKKKGLWFFFYVY